MPKEPFLLVSLKEDQAKKLAQIVSNDTSRKILDFLANRKDATETQIANELELPISTIHYNLQQLVKGKLVSIEEFHYSAKGKEVNHYKLANKFIIIAPQSTFGFKQKLRSILPAFILALASTAVIRLVTKPVQLFQEAAPLAAQAEAKIAESAALQIAPPPSEPNTALWFLFGAVLTVALYFIFEYISYLRQK